MVTSASTFIITMCLPCGNRRQRDLRADVRVAGRVDDHVDVFGSADVAIRLADGEPAAGDDARDGRASIVRQLGRAPAVAGDPPRREHVVGDRVGRRHDLDAGHEAVWTMMSVPIWPAPIRPTRTGLPWRWRRSRPSATEPPARSWECCSHRSLRSGSSPDRPGDSSGWTFVIEP